MNVNSRRSITIRNLIYKGLDECIKCGRAVTLTEAVLTRLDKTAPDVVSNQRLRHHWCGVSKYRPVHNPAVVIELIEEMIRDQVKVCPVCRTSWTTADSLDELVLCEYRGLRKVLHITCT